MEDDVDENGSTSNSKLTPVLPVTQLSEQLRSAATGTCTKDRDMIHVCLACICF
jgi:hypothetical protein